MSNEQELRDGIYYGVIDRSEQVVGFADTLDGALAFAETLGKAIYFDAPDEEESAQVRLAANGEVVQLGKARVRNAPQEALRAVYTAMKLKGDGPIVSMDDVNSMSSEQAWALLRPMFPSNQATKAGVIRPLKAYDTPKSMAENFLGQNYKTAKGTPENIRLLVSEASRRVYGQTFDNANVKGLSLLPHGASFTDLNVRRIRDELMSQVYGVQEVRQVRISTCTKASPECRASCLVFSGRNLADDYNTVKKYSLLQAFVAHPVAFCRMIVDSIQMHRDRCLKSKTMPLVRLNVFSDLPWELIFPELFDHFDGDNFVQFYDYTKIPGRKVPPNYDITFSFAGVEWSAEAMQFEINQNLRRVAVVFARIGKKPRLIEGKRQMVEIPLKPPPGSKGIPKSLWGLEVIDGDESDMRPFDPHPSIVALRWKTPANQGVTLVEADAFIVKGVVVGGQFVLAETPRFTPDYSDAEGAKSLAG